MSDPQQRAARIIEAVRGYVQRSLGAVADQVRGVSDRLGGLEQRLAALPADLGELRGEKGADGERGDKGRDGLDGVNGKDADPQVVAGLVSSAIEALLPQLVAAAVERELNSAVETALKTVPPAKDGRDADPEFVRQIVDERIAALPPAPAGKDADQALVRAEVERAVAALPPPASGRDGKDADPDEVRALVDAAVASLPPARAGRDADPAQIRAEVERAVAALPPAVAGKDGKDGVDGKDGRDAIEIDIADGITPTRRYARSTYAAVRGGLVKAARNTDLLPEGGDLEAAGWRVVWRGLDAADLEFGDDGRTVTLALRMTDGEAVRKSVRIPTTIYRGIFDEAASYGRGDAVTRDGSVWILQADVARGAPGAEGSGWQLSVKRGRDGMKGERGERGTPGKDGKE